MFVTVIIVTPDDYTAPTSVMVDPGDSRVCVTVTATQDNVDEPDETFEYTILAGMGDYTIGTPSSIIITIPGKSIFWDYFLLIFYSSSTSTLFL